MTMAMSIAVERGAKVVICASTGNTSASAAAYAARAGLLCAVVLPDGQIALGKLAQALIHGARVVPVHGNFDDALDDRARARRAARRRGRQLGEPGAHRGAEDGRVRDRRRARRRAHRALASRSATPATSPPTGAATAEYARARAAPRRLPRMLGWQAAGAAPIVRGEPVLHPETHRHRDPDRQPGVVGGRGRRARRVGRPHRRGHRRADPRGLPHARGRGGLLRRAGVGGVGRRAAPGRGRRPARGRRRRRVHRHRSRAQGSRTAPSREVQVGDAVDGRRRRRSPAALDLA